MEPQSALTRALGACCLVLGLASCANPINRYNAAQYHDWGIQAETAGDYKLAERNYERALINARLGRSPDSGISMAMYNLGRVKGYLCKHDDAEKLLTAALDLEEKTSGPESGLTTMRLFELARLHFDRRRYVASIPYFERAIPAVRKLGAEASDPIALADALDQYAAALAATGRTAESAEHRREAATIRARHPDKVAAFRAVSYERRCPRDG